MDANLTCPVSFTGLTGQSFASFINMIMVAQCGLSQVEQFPKDYGPDLEDGEEFDFIVVGAGSAGSVVANRLSENPNWKVLLIEAGNYPSLTTEVPQVFFTIARSEEDWGYYMEPSENSCLGLVDQKCLCPRGKTLGGSGAINGMLYIRGNRKDYDTWADQGNEGWDFDSVLKYFKKFEDLQDVYDDRMGTDGELKITKYKTNDPIRDIFEKAYKELGYREYSEESPQGYIDSYTNIYNGTRFSPAKAFLPAMKNRKNAYLVLKAQVSKVLLAPDLTATGVEMRLNGKMIKVKASKEVILSAGTINSPQILMNSGVGPDEHLEELDIPVLKDLEVGKNLQDHVFFCGLLFSMGPEVLHNITLETVMNNWYQYLVYRTGPLSQTAITNFFSLVNTKRDSPYPNVQIYYLPVHKNDPYNSISILVEAFNWPKEAIAIIKEQNKKSNVIFMAAALAYPKSIGKITLNSNDPFDKPKILTDYFSDENDEDLESVLEGVRFIQKLVKTKTFGPHYVEQQYMVLDNCKGFALDSDDYWKCAIKNMATTVYHLAGTCKMGPEDDPTAVVDSRLRVHGVKRLRVVDASIMPKIISCNINAPTMMVGQKASDMIKEDWQKKHTEL